MAISINWPWNNGRFPRHVQVHYKDIQYSFLPLVGWRPPLLGWRPSSLGRRPSLLGILSLQGLFFISLLRHAHFSSELMRFVSSSAVVETATIGTYVGSELLQLVF